ncbi:MAG: hypothetical protein OXU81_09840 [Gammaproteobacteria bacterium]|nr:hypothetical protein [Gammaproteobacteria bacterium]
MRSLADYAAGVAEGWSEDTLARMFIHDLPRAFNMLGAETQRRVLDDAPPLTGTRWDALLAAMAEHLAELHGHPTQPWMDEPERFLDETWVLDDEPSIRLNALAFGPPAFVRHGAVIDPRDLDARGGERHEWVPE